MFPKEIITDASIHLYKYFYINLYTFRIFGNQNADGSEFDTPVFVNITWIVNRAEKMMSNDVITDVTVNNFYKDK